MSNPWFNDDQVGGHDEKSGGHLLAGEALDAYDDLAREFIRKVDHGRAHSARTYGELKRILERRRT